MASGSQIQTRTTLIEVVTRVAAAEGVDAEALEPLYWSVDTDVFEQLTCQPGPGTELEFQYEGYTVLVNAGGEVSLREDCTGAAR